MSRGREGRRQRAIAGQCARHRAYPDRHGAIVALRRGQAALGKMDVYRCLADPTHYHVGHPQEREQMSIGIPYARQERMAGRWYAECPVCKAEGVGHERFIELTERKDFESFTGREYADHYQQQHASA